MKRYGAISGKIIPPVGNLRLARIISSPWVGNNSIRRKELSDSGEDELVHSVDEGTDGYSPDNDSGENCNRSDAFSELGTDEEAITDDPHRTASERDAAFGQGAVQAAVNIDSDTDVEFHDADVALPYKSAYTLRMLWEGMPRDGWVVDTAS
ncbi:hypothetical protein Pcac1_g12044 [Phytophthora cactorum]|nr:hypothetical protein Pcac1_g12044 [Phytophthora cactorum]